MFALKRLPILVALLFAIDLALAIVPLVDFWAGSPFNRLRTLFNLDREHTLPTWYSSMQWFCAGALFALFAVYACRGRRRGCLPVAMLALLCFAFSLDEVTAIHEWLGMQSDALLQSGSRRGTAFWNTGVWPFVIGLPVLGIVALLVRAMRHVFVGKAPGALRRLIIGLIIMFTGALVIELGANLIDILPENRGLALGQVVLEEFMEMLGVTFIVWSAYELLSAYGFELRVPAPAPECPADNTSSLSPLFHGAATSRLSSHRSS